MLHNQLVYSFYSVGKLTIRMIHMHIVLKSDTQARYVKFIIIRLTHANVWESMGKPCSCMQFIKSRIFYCKSRENPYQYYKSRENPYQYYKSRENPYQVLQVTRAASERAMKSKVRMIKSLSP